MQFNILTLFLAGCATLHAAERAKTSHSAAAGAAKAIRRKSCHLDVRPSSSRALQAISKKVKYFRPTGP